MTDESTELERHDLDALATIRTAIDRTDIDPERLGKMLDIFERLTQSEAKKQYAIAMNLAQKDMPPVVANKTNTQTNSKFAPLEVVNEQVRPVFLANGFSLSFGTDTSPLERHIRVTCDVLHNAGHERKYFVDWPIDDRGIKGTTNKTDSWATGSTLSYAQRYLTLLIFDIAVEKLDKDSQDVATISEGQVAKLNDLIVASETDLTKFLAWAGAETLDGILASKFRDAVRFLDRKVAERKP